MRTKSEQQMFSTGRRHVLFAAKLAATIALCIWIVAVVDWDQVWSELRRSNYWLLLLVVAIKLLGVTISSYKWQQCLRVHDVHYRLGELHRWYLVAMSLNFFLPTSIGGDGYRIYKTLNNPKAKSCAVLAVFFDRATGLAALLLLGYIAAIVKYVHDGSELTRGLVMLGTFGIVVGLAGLWVLVRWRLIQKLAKRKFRYRSVASIVRSIDDLRRHPGRAAFASAISFVFHANTLFGLWLLIYALGTTIDLAALTISHAAAQTIGMLPISLGGLGLVDASFIYFMAHYGLSLETGLATMLLSRVLLVPLIVLGGYFYFFDKSDRATNMLNPPRQSRTL